jgi:hypothetical protein
LDTIEGICLAFSDLPLEPTPDWTRLDDPTQPSLVASYTIDRGSQDETDLSDGGTASVVINDRLGYLDPTNTDSPVFALIQPLIQAGIARWNPVATEWDTRFRGFVRDFDYVFNPAAYVDKDGNTVGVNQLTISLVDIYEILNAIQMLPGVFGDTPPAASAGNVFFDDGPISGGSGGRFDAVMAAAGIDPAFYAAASGNITLWETVYSPAEPALTPLQEMALAEFPEVSNLFPDRLGRIVFHGREAQFDPAAVLADASPGFWDYHEWKAGDGAAVAASSSDTAHIREFSFNRGLGYIVNSAYATPLWNDAGQQLTAAEIAGQQVVDTSGPPSSIDLYGIRSWSKQSLLTKAGLATGNGGLAETKLFAQFQIDNKAAARNRITQMTFRPMRPGDAGAAANHLLLGKIDISDSITPYISSPGGGGFTGTESFFVRGVHEQVDGRIRDGVEPGDEGYDNVTLSVDVIPRAWFDVDPFTFS